ncbi:MAG TPA: Rieske 2Fe-2S domain-containing protein [Candidatus Baltobacteraceae bacterium]|jgi:biphenyl 2,3-dioxygenase ferredoxin subunit/benzene/toluene dioxygenase ferredoxin subunit|nr:Rieske 2Fe-2S domain-containing protein [Candidatus Baltobacteraceae bacterium]
MAFRLVCNARDVPRSECREFPIAGRSIIVCEYGGEYYAHSPFCSHLTFSLDYAPVRDGQIECSWHRYCYDVITGENVFPGERGVFGDPELAHPVAPLATFPLERRGDEIFVDIGL